MSEINDIRSLNDFRVSSFSKYKKTEVSKALLKSLIELKKENSIYWSVEMICSGMFFELWVILINYVSSYIYTANPCLPLYLSKRIEDFKNIVKNGYTDNELLLRNNEKIRKLFAELIGVIICSKQKNYLNFVKLKKDAFTVHEMSRKFVAKNTLLIDEVYLKEDPKETYMAFNEFAYNISFDCKNALTSCYWLEWIIEYEQICKKKKTKCICERRAFINVDTKFQLSIIWIVWEIILNESKKRGNFYYKICKTLLDIFCLRYSITNNKKFKGLIYYAIYILCDNIDTNISFINKKDKDLVNIIVSKVDNFYKQIKQNEISPNTDYLFESLPSKSNKEKSIKKIEIMNNINNLN